MIREYSVTWEDRTDSASTPKANAGNDFDSLQTDLCGLHVRVASERGFDVAVHCLRDATLQLDAI